LTFPPKNPLAVETAPNPNTIQDINLLTNTHLINTANSLTPNLNKPTTKNPTRNLPNPISLSRTSPNQNSTSQKLPVTNATKKDIHPVSAKLIPNFMSFK
jgi:hypothetical protein